MTHKYWWFIRELHCFYHAQRNLQDLTQTIGGWTNPQRIRNIESSHIFLLEWMFWFDMTSNILHYLLESVPSHFFVDIKIFKLISLKELCVFISLHCFFSISDPGCICIWRILQYCAFFRHHQKLLLSIGWYFHPI